MPKRVIDGEAMWGSDKLHACPLWARKEYPWLYSLADAFGSFELNLRVIAAKLRPNRPDLGERKLEAVFGQFSEHGLAFIWSENGKLYLHWTGSEAPGRLPTASRRSKRYEKQLAPTVPKKAYQSYVKAFTGNGSVQQPNETLRSALAFASASASASASAVEEHDYSFTGKHLKIATDQHKKLSETYPNIDLQKEYAEMDIWLDTQKEENRWENQYAGARNWCKRIVDRQEKEKSEASPEAAVGRGPRTEGKPGKCSECGSETTPGFTKCHSCITKQAPVNP